MSNIQQLRNKLERQKGKQAQIQKDINRLEDSLKTKNKSLIKHEQAKEIIRKVGMETQQQIQVNISDITSLALEAVFPDPYELKVNFIQRRNKTECDLTFVRDGNEIDPIEASGVGAIDVAAFALRIASWSMNVPHTRNTIILDEPFRFLSANYQEQASTMLKELSKRLGIQFIIVTHEEVLASYADRTFVVSQNKKTKRSNVKII